MQSDRLLSFVTKRVSTRMAGVFLAVGFLAVGLVIPAIGQDRPANGNAPQSPEQTNAAIDEAVSLGISFLKNRGQSADGFFSPESGVAVTGLCVRAILENRPTEVDSPAVKKALQVILDHVQPDGGIYVKGSRHRNYETSVAVGALVAANRDDRFDSQLKRAEAFLKEIQWDEGEGVTPADPAYGGAGYGSHSRPDLSNTSFMIDALRDLGNDANDEAIKKALIFVSRSQNLAGHGNDLPHATAEGDGGFYYTPAAGGETKVVGGDTRDAGGGLRSYGSISYAGFKSLIHAGLTESDPRVIAAMNFIQDHYSLTENPGMGQAGLYYYYHTFAKALHAAKIRVLTDADGNNHFWNRELVMTLTDVQQDDGSWVNRASDRWMEGNRNLVTAYSLLALSYCRE
ncbi:terpene cyclase/mutase family protein [Stieleria sp. ICT_E10.1]|uniref:prenyltransferase/squalene oxidase repeat-containing protein n=1 Tax=Stieleria sedimenti TaxID=2976331 RepID=UPI0021805053|nr:terpene cyclase/mutase family protein [Stieleria sedimenti]MCS7470556.1 terpene cyclase/mutase family protein [Stieleria sedimenti]